MTDNRSFFCFFFFCFLGNGFVNGSSTSFLCWALFQFFQPGWLPGMPAPENLVLCIGAWDCVMLEGCALVLTPWVVSITACSLRFCVVYQLCVFSWYRMHFCATPERARKFSALFIMVSSSQRNRGASGGKLGLSFTVYYTRKHSVEENFSSSMEKKGTKLQWRQKAAHTWSALSLERSKPIMKVKLSLKEWLANHHKQG